MWPSSPSAAVAQSPTLHSGGLEAVGAVQVFVDVASGATAVRPELTATLDYMRPGDVLTVWRLGRWLRDLIDHVHTHETAGVGFRSLSEAIDTTPGGRLIFHAFGSLAEFERQLIVDHTNADLAVAGAVRGPPALSAAAQR